MMAYELVREHLFNLKRQLRAVGTTATFARFGSNASLSRELRTLAADASKLADLVDTEPIRHPA